ncbi:hypothetical protein OL444_13885 [Chitinophaga sp. PC15]|uniref:NAD-dependent epimerase/dehydratase domain-containing protein n=1 Tax=Chitinophaga nivalis TaxID=2991709 RepID=A0ABT3IPA3_9BACT|nr:NAD-dependent epimerase/dehydratase family protein [Chitinophaga nivalis]MCW3464536.1 hypothetical protein [Chitinophaga nivalis]MCW3485773.1 hypothetical protein [Chitinophaga nivalis]
METTPKQQTALVVGGNGITGRTLAQHLLASGNWQVIITSQSELGYTSAAQYVQMNLLEPGAVQQQAAVLRNVTHIFFAAYVECTTLAEQTAVNTALLENLVTGMEAIAPHLEHITFVQGAKHTALIWVFIKHRHWKPMPDIFPLIFTTHRKIISGNKLPGRPGAGPLYAPISYLAWQ